MNNAEAMRVRSNITLIVQDMRDRMKEQIRSACVEKLWNDTWTGDRITFEAEAIKRRVNIQMLWKYAK